jgi:plasmid stabilization system protein ParE
MVQINWTNQAVFDLKEITAYISKDSKKYARLQVQRLKVRTHIFKTNPFSGPSIDFF